MTRTRRGAATVALLLGMLSAVAGPAGAMSGTNTVSKGGSGQTQAPPAQAIGNPNPSSNGGSSDPSL